MPRPSARPILLSLLLLAAPFVAPSLAAQPQVAQPRVAQPQMAPPADTLFAWQTYGRDARVRVQTFVTDDDKRPRTVVVDELAQNDALVTDDVRYFVDTFGRAVGLDPTEATFVFRFDGRSFREDADTGKTLLLRATFNRTKSGALGSPSWRLLTRAELAELTDRALY